MVITLIFGGGFDFVKDIVGADPNIDVFHLPAGLMRPALQANHRAAEVGRVQWIARPVQLPTKGGVAGEGR